MSAAGERRRFFRLPRSRSTIDRELDDEFQFHLEGRIEELVAAGLPPHEARAEALRRFGDPGEYRRQAHTIDEAQLRQEGRLEFRETARRELRHAVRALIRTPAFSAIAVITLAIGIGATTAIFTVLDRVVLRPLPYPAAEELVSVHHPTVVPGTGESIWGLSSAGYFVFKNENRTLQSLGAYRTTELTIAGDGEAERVKAGLITQDLFGTLGARPHVGRLFGSADDVPNGPRVAVLGYDLWQRRYGGDPNVVGRTIQTSYGTFEVVGIVHRGFALPKPGPFSSANDLAGFRTDVWLPLQLDPDAPAANSHQFGAIGRLASGVIPSVAESDLQRLTNTLPERYPRAYSQGFFDTYQFRLAVEPLRDAVLGPSLARTLWVLLGAAALVLLIAVANVANLFLVRIEMRRRDAALRTALGASRARLTLHALTEGLVLGAAAGAIGLGIAWLGVRAMLALAPTDVPRLAGVSLGWAAVGFGVALALASGVLFGMLPMLRGVADPSALRDGARGSSHSHRQRRARSGLVVAQVSLALMLLASAGLMLRSVAHLRQVEPGLDPTSTLAFTIAVPPSDYETAEAVAEFHRQLQETIGAMPGVTAVGAINRLPLRDFGVGCAVVFREGRPYADGEDTPCVETPKATPGVFRALGVRVEGREPTWDDVASNTGAVVVTRALADRMWPGEDPIGKGINSNGGTESGYYRIVGVVPELRASGLDHDPVEAVFYPAVGVPNSWIWGPMSSANYVVRSSLADPAILMPRIRQAVTAMNAGTPITEITSMEAVVERSMARISFIMLLLGAAAVAALTLSAVGLYGVISYLVSQRRGEIGVRIALGAHAAQVARMVMRQSLVLTAAGLLIGLAGAFAGTRLLSSLLYGVAPTDPVTLLGGAGLLVVVAAAASFGPARRAARVDPVDALRSS